MTGIPLLRVRNTIVTNENEEAFLDEIMKFLELKLSQDRNFAPALTSGGVEYLVVEAGTFKICKTSDAYETAACLYKDLICKRQKSLDFFFCKDK